MVVLTLAYSIMFFTSQILNLQVRQRPNTGVTLNPVLSLA